MFQLAVAPEIEVRQWTLADADACFEAVERNRDSLAPMAAMGRPDPLGGRQPPLYSDGCNSAIRGKARPELRHLGRRQSRRRNRLPPHRLGESLLRAGLLARCKGSLPWRDDAMLRGASPLSFRGVEIASRVHPLRYRQHAKLRHPPTSRVPSRGSGTGSGMGGRPVGGSGELGDSGGRMAPVSWRSAAFARQGLARFRQPNS